MRTPPISTLLRGVILGAAATYFFDPDRGKARQAMARDKLNHYLRKGQHRAEGKKKHLSHLWEGVKSEIRRGWHAHDKVTDEILEARVRSVIGRCLCHPHNLQVQARDGEITLRGEIIREEFDPLLYSVAETPGVLKVRDELLVHEGDDIPYVPPHHPGRGGSKLLCAALGGGLLGKSLRKRGVMRAAYSGLGLVLLSKMKTEKTPEVVTNYERAASLLNISARVSIARPLQEVFAFSSTFENFPHFVPGVYAVLSDGDGAARWTTKGPLGGVEEWTSSTTVVEPGRCIAWCSDTVFSLPHEVVLTFKGLSRGNTEVDVQVFVVPRRTTVSALEMERLRGFLLNALEETLLIYRQILEGGQIKEGQTAAL